MIIFDYIKDFGVDTIIYNIRHVYFGDMDNQDNHNIYM